jgi:hypothetical protein
MRLLAKSNTTRRMRPSLKSADWSVGIRSWRPGGRRTVCQQRPGRCAGTSTNPTIAAAAIFAGLRQTVVIPSPRGEGLHGLEVDDKVEFGGLLDRKTRRARTRASDDVRIKDDAAGPDSNVLRLSGRRATDPRIPLQEVFSSQFFRAPLGRTSSRTALARRKSGPRETLAQLSQQPLQQVLEIQCVSRMSEMRCASWDDSLPAFYAPVDAPANTCLVDPVGDYECDLLHMWQLGWLVLSSPTRDIGRRARHVVPFCRADWIVSPCLPIAKNT